MRPDAQPKKPKQPEPPERKSYLPGKWDHPYGFCAGCKSHPKPHLFIPKQETE